MKLSNSVPSQVNVGIIEILKKNLLYSLKLPVFKFLGERTNHSENEQVYHPNFVWYVGTSSSGDMNPMSYHLTAFELTNQLLYTNFPGVECKIFQKDLKSTLRRLLRCDFVTWVMSHFRRLERPFITS